MFLQVFDTPRGDAILLPLPKRLSHLPQKVLRFGNGHVGTEVGFSVQHGLIDPFRELAALLLESSVAEDHDSVVILSSEHTPQALCRMPHGVERKEIILADSIVLAQEFETRFQDTRLCVLEWHSDTEHSAAIMVVEIDTFRDFTSGDTEEDSASAVTACCAVGFQRQGGLLRVGRLNEYQLEFPDLVKNAHALPHADDRFHVEIRGEENDYAVRSNFRKLHE